MSEENNNYTESNSQNYTPMPENGDIKYTQAPDTNNSNNPYNNVNNSYYDNNGTNNGSSSYYDSNGINGNNTYYNGSGNDYTSGKGQGHGFGIAALICGIISLIGCCGLWFISVPCAIAAIILGIVQLIKNQPKAMAIVGIICGALGLLLTVVVIVAAVVFMSNVTRNPDIYDEIMDEIMDEYGVTEDMLEDYGIDDDRWHGLEGL